MTHFYRVYTDLHTEPVAMEDVFAGPGGASCFIAGGSPALEEVPKDAIASGEVPVFGINKVCERIRCDLLNATDVLWHMNPRPFLSPRVLTFAPVGRWDNLMPGTNRKACEMPRHLFYHGEPAVEYWDFLADDGKIPWWNDCLFATLAIAYWLGFRRLYLIGVSLWVNPEEPYAFDEPFHEAANNKKHYYENAQRLRLLRHTFDRHGLDVISCTPDSLLNDYFPYRDVEQVVLEEDQRLPHYSTKGSYTEHKEPPLELKAPMADVLPPNRGAIRKKGLAADFDADLPSDPAGLHAHHQAKFAQALDNAALVQEKLDHEAVVQEQKEMLNPNHEDGDPARPGIVAGTRLDKHQIVELGENGRAYPVKPRPGQKAADGVIEA